MDYIELLLTRRCRVLSALMRPVRDGTPVSHAHLYSAGWIDGASADGGAQREVVLLRRGYTSDGVEQVRWTCRTGRARALAFEVERLEAELVYRRPGTYARSRATVRRHALLRIVGTTSHQCVQTGPTDWP